MKLIHALIYIIITATISLPAYASQTQSAQDNVAILFQAIRPPCSDSLCKSIHNALNTHNYHHAAQLYLQQVTEQTVFSSNSTRWTIPELYILSAYAYQNAGMNDIAQRYFQLAARELPAASNYLLLQAAKNLVVSQPSSRQLDEALSWPVYGNNHRDAHFIHTMLQAKQHALPLASTLESALKDSSEKTCAWIDNYLREWQTPTGTDKNTLDSNLAPILDAIYGYCADDAHLSLLSKFSHHASAQAHLNRAGLYFFAVRFTDAYKELQKIDFNDLTPSQKCTANFVLARTLDRLRQRTRAQQSFQTVIENCSTGDNDDERVRSLYAVGRHNYQTGRLQQAKSSFETLLQDYPQRSHADDALFFLARIARKKNAPSAKDEQDVLLNRALTQYPDGDMVHEMVWEIHEHLYRNNQYHQFIERITSLELPDYDNQYFSQGRLEYFLGASHHTIATESNVDNSPHIKSAISYWQTTWEKYPFSFYGYLSHLQLLRLNIEPKSLSNGYNEQDSRVLNKVSTKLSNVSAGAHLFARLGLYKPACDMARNQNHGHVLDNTQKWHVAAFCHIAGDYSYSHNLARRQISGRPWSTPEHGRWTRWTIAWPNPYHEIIATAVQREKKQWDTATDVHSAFASAIIREESSFIPDIESWAGALGLMQLMPQTALSHDSDIEGRATAERLKTPEINIRVGVDHLFSLAQRYNNHPALMAAAYNAGSGRVNQWKRRFNIDDIALWVESIPFLETRDYTKRVIGSYAAYQWLTGHHNLDSTVLNAP